MKTTHPVLKPNLQNLDTIKTVGRRLLDLMEQYQDRHEHIWFVKMSGWCDHEETHILKKIGTEKSMAWKKEKRKNRLSRFSF